MKETLPRSLPKGWISLQSKKHKDRKYYYHKKRKLSFWTFKEVEDFEKAQHHSHQQQHRNARVLKLKGNLQSGKKAETKGTADRGSRLPPPPVATLRALTSSPTDPRVTLPYATASGALKPLPEMATGLVKGPGMRRESPDLDDMRMEVDEVVDQDEMEEDMIIELHDLCQGASNNLLDNQSKETLVIVLDTNILLNHLKFIMELNKYSMPGLGNFILKIPWVVLQELDGIKMSQEKKTNLKQKSQTAINFIHTSLENKDTSLKVETLSEVAKAARPTDLTNDDQILNCCLSLKTDGSRVILFSNDKNLCSKALANQVRACTAKSILNGLKEETMSNHPTMTSANSYSTISMPNHPVSSANSYSTISMPNHPVSSANSYSTISMLNHPVSSANSYSAITMPNHPTLSSAKSYSTISMPNHSVSSANSYSTTPMPKYPTLSSANSYSPVTTTMASTKSRPANSRVHHSIPTAPPNPQAIVLAHCPVSTAVIHPMKPASNPGDQKQLSKVQIVKEIKSILTKSLSLVLETEMKEAYEDLWLKIVTVKPPWTLSEIFTCFTKHWIAVFGLIIPRSWHDRVKSLKDLVTTINSDQEWKDFFDQSYLLLAQFRRHSNYKGELPAALKKLSQLMKSLSVEVPSEGALMALEEPCLEGVVTPVVRTLDVLVGAVNHYAAISLSGLGVTHGLAHQPLEEGQQLPGPEKCAEFIHSFMPQLVKLVDTLNKYAISSNLSTLSQIEFNDFLQILTDFYTNYKIRQVELGQCNTSMVEMFLKMPYFQDLLRSKLRQINRLIETLKEYSN